MTERSRCSQRARAPGTPVQRVATPFTLVVRSIVAPHARGSIDVMGLIARLRRWYHLWVWRLRYWWYDTPSGVCAQHWALGLGVLVLIVKLVRVCVCHGAACTARRTHTGRLLVGVATGDCGCGGLRVGGVASQTGAGQTTAGAGAHRSRRSSGETSLWHRLGR